MKSYIIPLMFQKTSWLRFAFLLGSLIFLFRSDVNATHIVGGDLTYRCLGNNMYEIRLTVRRDCFLGAPDAQFDDPAVVGFFDGQSFQLLEFIGFSGQLFMDYNADDTLNQVLISDCSVVSGDVCVHQTTYVDTIFLPFRASGYIMSYQRCCRNSSLTNVLNPLGTGMTLVAELSGNAQTECNSSPQFGDYPPIYICVNKEINFSHAAEDVEGDSLVYSLCTPYSGATIQNPKPQPPAAPPYNPIVYRAPYSLANLLGGTPLAIDPNTGVITGTPNSIGQFVVGICVTAYKNGVMTGTTRRDFQYNVRQCRDVPVAEFSAPELDCEDLTVVFSNQSMLADEYKWYFNWDNYPNTDSSTSVNPTYTYPQNGFYNVALIVNDSNEFCFDTIIHQIGVFDSQISADFSYDVNSCSEEIVLEFTDLSFDPDPGHDIISWEWLITVGGNVIPSVNQNPTITFDIDSIETVFAALIVTSSNGCTGSVAKTFPVRLISLAFNPESDSICFGDTTHLLLNGEDDLTYTWDPTLGLDLTDPSDPIAFPGVNVVYSVTVTDGLCEVTGSTPVAVQQLPVLAFTYETDCKSLLVAFNNGSQNAINYHWDFGTGNPGDTTLVPEPTFTFPDSGIYTVTLSSRDGCDVSVSAQVTADAITEDLGEDMVSCFDPTVFLNPDNNPGYIYIWSDPSLTGPNPEATVIDDTEFFVTITSPGLPGCEIVDSITIIVPDDFNVNAGNDDTTCVFSPITLTATLDTNVEVTYEWTDENGNVIGNESSVVVTPALTDTFYVKATDSLGCSKTDFVIIYRPEPTFFVEAPDDTAYCGIQIITLTGESSPGVTLEWFNENGELVGQGASVQVTPGSGPSCFTLLGTDAVGCEDTAAVCLTPTFFDLDISGDQSICLDETVEVFVIDHLGQDLDFLWSPIESIISGAATDTAVVRPTETTTYTVLVTNNELGCTQELSTEVVVNVFEPFPVIVTADPDSITITQPVQLTVNQPSNFGYSWSSSTGEAVDNIFNPVVFPSGNPTTYTVTVTNEAGCTAVASVTIGVADPACDETDIFIPNAFTPNNDGVNDVLFVRSNFISTMDLHIYNRWGEQVFQTNDVNIGWDGTFNGKRLAPDVYGYYMNISCPNEKSHSQKGNITLLE